MVALEAGLVTLVLLLQAALQQPTKDMTVETVLQQVPILQEEAVAQVAQVATGLVLAFNVDMVVLA